MYIEIKDVKKSYGKGDSFIQVLKGVNCEIEKGEMVAILGSSGSGKTTLLNCIGGLETIEDGQITIDGWCLKDISKKDLIEFRRDKIGFIFQFYNLIPNLTIKQNIEVGKMLGKNPLDYEELINTLHLTEQQYKYPSELSGGQQQRCSIARALIKGSDILLCDEPTGALDSKTAKEILVVLEEMNRKYHTTIIMVTHNTAIAKMMDKVITLKDGLIHDITINEKKVNACDLTDL